VRFASQKGFESFCREGGALFYEEEKKKSRTKKSRAMGIKFDEGKAAAAGANLYDT